MNKKTIIAFAGLPATGKTTLATLLGKKLKCQVISKDVIRFNFIPKKDINYSREEDDFCMSLVYKEISYLFSKKKNRIVIIDGRTYSKSYQINDLLQFVDAFKSNLFLIECKCSDDTAKRRLTKKDNHFAKNRNFKLYLDLKKNSNPIKIEKLVLNTEKLTIKDCLKKCLAYVSKA